MGSVIGRSSSRTTAVWSSAGGGPVGWLGDGVVEVDDRDGDVVRAGRLRAGVAGLLRSVAEVGAGVLPAVAVEGADVVPDANGDRGT